MRPPHEAVHPHPNGFAPVASPLRAVPLFSGRAATLESTVLKLSSMIEARFDLLTESPFSRRHVRKHRVGHVAGASKVVGAYHLRQEDRVQDGERHASRERPLKRRERTSSTGRAAEAAKLVRTTQDPGTHSVRSPVLDA